MRYEVRIGPGFDLAWEGGIPVKEGGSNNAAAIGVVDCADV